MLLKNKYVNMSACMLALLLCVMVARPFASVGIQDDWSYIWTARVLADTGHFVYNGWATAMLGWQVFLGALFIKLFGFSFTVVRSSVLIVSLLCAALMQRVFARVGVSEWTASIATLTLVLSPLFLPLAFSFFSDVPSLFVLVLCIYCCLRAVQSVSDKAALGWLGCAALSNVAGGTVRQIAWLGALVIVPAAAWYMRRRRHMLLTGAALWILCVLSIALCMRWFRLQPYSVTEKIFFEYHTVTAFYEGSAIIVGLLILLPVMSAFLLAHPSGKRLARSSAAIAGAIGGSIFFWWAVTSPVRYFRTIPFGRPGNCITSQGFTAGAILGVPPEVIPIAARFVLTALTFAAFASVVACLIGKRNASPPPDIHTPSHEPPYPYVSNAALITLLAPFTVTYAFLIITRIAVYDRYFLPLLFVFTLGLVRFYTQTISDRLPWLCLVVGLVYAVYGVASTHDLFAFERARVDAASEITAAGIPRTEIAAGFAFDGWTQLEQTGYVNEPKIENPADAYQPWVPPDAPPLCIVWFASYTPSVHPLLHLSHAPDNCYHPSQFAPVVYRTWLPPWRRTIYILDSR